MKYKILESTKLSSPDQVLCDDCGEPLPKSRVRYLHCKRCAKYATTRYGEKLSEPAMRNWESALDLMVREHIKKGWKPLGGPGSWGGEAQPPQFYQAMVKD